MMILTKAGVEKLFSIVSLGYNVLPGGTFPLGYRLISFTFDILMSSSIPAPGAASSSPSGRASGKPPTPVFETIFAFPPNRETLGGTAYLICETSAAGQPANILVDCPALNETNRQFIESRGGIDWLFITHRGGMSQVKQWLADFEMQVLIQEQEAYLLPGLTVSVFHREQMLSPDSRVFWTPGHSPGSSCLYHQNYGGVLFTGRHLLPSKQGAPQPLRLSKTFHWPRQLRYGQQLLEDFSPETLHYLCPGASTGFLRGEKKIDSAYTQLQEIDWQGLRSVQAVL